MHEHGHQGRLPQVVLVDDYEPALLHLAELLPMYGVEVVGMADRGDAVLETLERAGARSGGVDVVVMDVRMPGTCGLDATRQVRAAYPAVQVILHSAYGDYLSQAGREAGAFAEIAKGARPDTLVHAIRSACGMAEVTGELPDPAAVPGLAGTSEVSPAAGRLGAGGGAQTGGRMATGAGLRTGGGAPTGGGRPTGGGLGASGVLGVPGGKG